MAPAATGPLSPSQEEAYRIKCIELTTRMKEVAAENDQLRLRKARLTRGIKKMRLERAILLDAIKQRMPKDDVDAEEDEETEDSSDSPPTPQERPLRTKKSHRRITTSPIRNTAAKRAAAAAAAAAAAEEEGGDGGSVKVETADGEGGGSGGGGSGGKDKDKDKDKDKTPESEAYRAFAHNLLNEILPTDPNSEIEVKDDFNGDYQAYARKKWDDMADADRIKWESKELKPRKKGGRASKAGSGGDVEMKDSAD